MPYTPHYLLQFGGTLGTPIAEIWSCGIRLHTSGSMFVSEQDYLEDVAVPALAAWMARPTTSIASHCKLTFAKFNRINSEGKYDDADTNEYFWPSTGIAGGGAAIFNPFQTSVVVSFRTNAVSRGPASKGRIYQPAPTISSTATGVFAPAVALGIATSMATLINTLDIGVLEDTMRPHIMSNIGAAYNQIDWVDCDNRLDVQRRRANNLVATYSEVEVLY